MNAHFFRWALLLFLVFPFAVGCGEQRLPGMPPLVPASVTVMQDGHPLAGASVSLLGADDITRQWPAGGITDVNGVAHLRTGGKFDGAAVGIFRVTVNKTERPENPFAAHADSDSANHQDYLREQKKVNANTFIVVDRKFSSNDTPLSLEIVKGQKDYTVDVSPAVKIKFTQVTY